MTPPRTLSEEQLAVIQAEDDDLTVVAAAGAGKTLVLVERYLRHVVEKGVRPDQILTITFTKKAAAEMKKRIVARLLDHHRFDEAQIAETGPIQTLHSFCERTLRENALEAGLDPQFEIIDGSHTDRMIQTCVREALAEPGEEMPHVEALLSFLAGQPGDYGGPPSPYAKLEGEVKKVLDQLRGSGRSQAELLRSHQSPEVLMELWEMAAIQAADERVPGTAQSMAELTPGPLVERIRAAGKKASEGAGVSRLLSWVKSDGTEVEAEALIHSCGLVQLACAAWWRLDREMNAHQKLDFTALEERAVRLLCQSDVTRRRIAQQYPVVMVDEAQDLNPVQYQLLDAIRPDHLLLVGDAQQSIYGFRQADPKLFQARASRPGVRRLSRNYRSDLGILEFVDRAFGRVWDKDYMPMAPPKELDLEVHDVPRFDGVEAWKQAKDDADAVACYLRELHSEGIPYRDIAVLVRDSPGASRMEMGLRSAGVPYRIAGGSERFYTRLEVRDLANALRAVADPYDDFALLACLRSPVVGLSLDSVVMASLHRPVVEHLAGFVPPLPEDVAKLADFLTWFEPLRSIVDRLSAWEVMAELFAKSRLLTTLARREGGLARLANVRKLLALAAKEPELGPLEYAERVREIQDLRHKEGEAPADELDADLVTLMTIHKAKGLEFPVVVLPQTYKGPVRRTPDVLLDVSRGLVVTSFGRGRSLAFNLLDDLRKVREEEEERRVLYVALTRAKHRLCICLYPVADAHSISRLFRDLGPDAYPGVRVRESEQLSARDSSPRG